MGPQTMEVAEQPKAKETINTKPKPVDFSQFTPGQRATLKAGLTEAMKDSPQFIALGASQKSIFYDTVFMFLKPESLRMLNLKGAEYWRDVPIPGTDKKEKVRFLKFTFDYVIPGTTSSITAVKEWRYEDFV